MQIHQTLKRSPRVIHFTAQVISIILFHIVFSFNSNANLKQTYNCVTFQKTVIFIQIQKLHIQIKNMTSRVTGLFYIL